MGRPGNRQDRHHRETASLDAATLLDAAQKLPDSTSPEAAYAAAIPHAHRRAHAQFFTPPAIAELMADWALAHHPRTLLDPALGLGALTRAARARAPHLSLTAFEKDPVILAAYRATSAAPAERIIAADFLTTDLPCNFDAELMNPPYLRHHDMAYGPGIFADFSTRHGVTLSRLSNAYVLFTLKAAAALTPGGRAAIIIPAEWMNANFGTALKHFLLDQRLLREIVLFSHGTDIFGDALTTACLLFLENPGSTDHSATIRTWHLNATTDAPRSLADLHRTTRSTSFAPTTLRDASKWEFLIREGAHTIPAGFVTLRHLATTKRGIATGANDFFHLTPSVARALNLPESALLPCIGRAADVAYTTFTDADLAALQTRDRPTLLLAIGKTLGPAEQNYIATAEASGLHRRYLLAARRPWYAMETRTPAPIWAAVFGRAGLRFIHNRTHALSLTTFHAIYPHNTSEDFAAALTLCLNAPSIQSAARAQSRVYGGGLLKFEPRDLLDIAVPNLASASPATRAALAAEHAGITASHRSGTKNTDALWKNAERLITQAAGEAAGSARP